VNVCVLNSCGRKIKNTEPNLKENTVNYFNDTIAIQDSLIINRSGHKKNEPISEVYDDDWGEYYVPNDTLKENDKDTLQKRSPITDYYDYQSEVDIDNASKNEIDTTIH
jgi:hypothetical protein